MNDLLYGANNILIYNSRLTDFRNNENGTKAWADEIRGSKVRGLCHECLSSDMELQLNHNGSPVCNGCLERMKQKNHEQIKYEYSQKVAELDAMKKKHSEILG